MFKQSVFDPEADFDEEIQQHPEEEDSAPKKGLKNGSIYDDDEFEMNAEWNSDSIYKDILGARNRRRVCQVSDKPSIVSLPSASAELKEEVPEVVLNLPKGGWQIQKVELEVESSDFPTLVQSASLAKDKPMQKAFSNVSVPTKWKNVTKDFFQDDEEDEREEEKFTQVRQKSAGPRSAGKTFHPRAQGPSYPTQRTGLRKPYQPSGTVQADTQPQSAKPTQEADDSAKKPNEEFKNTRMCSFLDKCKRRGCTFAHTIEDYTPVECRFQFKCKSVDSTGNYTCRFKHKD